MKKNLATLALLALFVPMLAGCGKEPTAPVSNAVNAPAVPPASSMNFDFGFFDAHGAAQTYAAHPNGAEATLERSHWINAVVRVVYLNLTVADMFETPVLALQTALAQKPVLGDDGWYTWSYAFSDSGHNVSLKLRARVDGSIVTWRMLATDPQAVPAMNDFLWFSGETRLQNDRGFWLFHDLRNGAAVPVARIDWYNGAERDRSLTFRNVDGSSPDLDDSLEYRVADALVSVTLHDQSAGTNMAIVWNETTGTGSLTAPDYNNGVRACWDAAQQNTVCPE